ncbi:hypothetical protein H8E50_05230 [bacterium]|nr:hypothetical protein [bacterium]
MPAAVKSVILAGSYSGALITGLSAILNEQQLLKYYPAIINSVLASIFLYTIFYPPTAIESLARIKNKNLPPEGVLYTRNVTWAWVIFFLCNGGVAAATAVYGSMSQWMLYNGLLSYFAIGLMLIGERLIRAWKLGE